jgi:hypothetical protein
MQDKLQMYQQYAAEAEAMEAIDEIYIYPGDSLIIDLGHGLLRRMQYSELAALARPKGTKVHSPFSMFRRRVRRLEEQWFTKPKATVQANVTKVLESFNNLSEKDHALITENQLTFLGDISKTYPALESITKRFQRE